ncbi:MAG: helix-turn-helix domain-containing protein [Oscillospiraceae bacterium]|nr:helix-turn-helix domain-containing protein [Oscillospiraceae bacterium]
MINHQLPESVLTVRDLSEYLRIGRDSAYALVRSGQIRSVRIGRQIRIPRAAVDAYLSGETKACQDASQQV